MPKPLLQAQQYIQPQYVQPQYIQPQYPHYQEPATPFNSNLVAITGLGLVVGAVFLYFKNPFANLFKKNPEKDQDTNYANLGMRLYAALGRMKNNDEKELFSIAKEVYDEMKQDPKFWEKVKDWFVRKYDKTVYAFFTTTGVTAAEQKRFNEILANGNFDEKVETAVAEDKAGFDKLKEITGNSSPTVIKPITSLYQRGEYVVSKPTDSSGRAIRKTPELVDGLLTHNRAFRLRSGDRQILGVATGKTFESEKDGKKYVWVEILHKASSTMTAERIVANFKKIGAATFTEGTISYQNFVGYDLKTMVSPGFIFYTAASNLEPSGTIPKNATLAQAKNIIVHSGYYCKQFYAPLSGLGDFDRASLF